MDKSKHFAKNIFSRTALLISTSALMVVNASAEGFVPPRKGSTLGGIVRVPAPSKECHAILRDKSLKFRDKINADLYHDCRSNFENEKNQAAVDELNFRSGVVFSCDEHFQKSKDPLPKE